MSWRTHISEQIADWMRFSARAALLTNTILAALASLFLGFWLIFRLSQYLYLKLFSEPW